MGETKSKTQKQKNAENCLLEGHTEILLCCLLPKSLPSSDGMVQVQHPLVQMDNKRPGHCAPGCPAGVLFPQHGRNRSRTSPALASGETEAKRKAAIYPWSWRDAERRRRELGLNGGTLKLKDRASMGPSNPPGHIHSQKPSFRKMDGLSNAHSTIIYNSQDMETPQMSTDRGVDKDDDIRVYVFVQVCVCIYTRVNT